MVGFNVDGKVQDNVELGAVDKNQVMDGGVGRRDQTHQARATRARSLCTLALQNYIKIVEMVHNLLSKVSVEIALSLEGTFAIGRIELEIDSCFCKY